MPRNYVRKRPDRKLVTDEQVTRAKKLIAKGMSQRRAAEEVGISEGGLRKRLKNTNVPISLGRFRPTFNEAQESEFASHCKKLDAMFFGLPINNMRRLAYEFAAANNIQHRFNESSKMAGRDWVECFLRRQSNLCLRQSAPTSLARAIGFNRVQVERFYKNLKEVYDKYQFPPNKIYNMDETGMSTVPKKTPKVVSVRGKKVVGKIVSAERGTTITAVLSMSVTGHFIPPAFIYRRKRPRSELLDGCPLQSILMVSDSGFINSELFISWLQHFKHFTHPTKEEPVLLVLDNHSSHISLEATRYARANNIVMVTLPPHGSHKLQPLDVAIHSPLKTKYAIECEKWMTQHPGRGITQFQVASLFNAAFKQVATMSNAESGFRATGIYPFADDIFDDVDFAPSSTLTDQVLGTNEPREEVFNLPSIENAPEMNEHTVSPSLLDNDYMQMGIPSTIEVDIAAQASNINTDSINTCVSITDVSIGKQAKVFKRNKSVTEKIDAAESNISSNKENIQTDNQTVKLADLSPLPKIAEKKKTSRVSLKSEIVTATPYKNQLEEKRRIENENKARKRIKLLNLDPQPGPSGINRNRVKNIKSTHNIRKKSKREDIHYCPICKEKYQDPPSEEWIQCCVCEKWFHEECTVRAKLKCGTEVRPCQNTIFRCHRKYEGGGGGWYCSRA